MNHQTQTEMQRLLRRLISLTEGETESVARFLDRPENWPNSLHSDEVKVVENRTPDSVLAKIAKFQIKSRNIRAQFFHRDMFSEGGWVILLELFVSENAGRKMSITDACVASGLPATTALRHLNLLHERGYIGRQSDPGDGRREFIEFSKAGRKAMRDTLEAIRKLYVDQDIEMLAS